MFDLRARTHLLTIAGSRAYGLHTAGSDVDIKGFAIPPGAWYHGVLRSFDQADDADVLGAFVEDLRPDERDVVTRTKLEGSVYELRKLVRLAMDANPNILDVLFCRDDEVRRLSPIGRALRDQRDLFVTRRCRHTFAGYAVAQLKRIKLHYRWHHQGPERPPTRAEFGLPEVGLLPRDQIQAAEAAVRKKIERWTIDWGEVPEPERLAVEAQIERALAELHLGDEAVRWAAAARWVGLGENLIHVMQQERAFGAAQDEWRRYLAWKRDRNPERATLEARHGYDTKHAMHLVRLLRMAGEILETGRVNVWRGDRDADELRGIRDGAWSYDRLMTWATEADAALARAERCSTLPRGPDRERIDALCVRLVEASLG